MKDTCIAAERNSAPLAARRKAFGVIPSKMIWGVLACCFVFVGSQLSHAQGPTCTVIPAVQATDNNTVLMLATTLTDSAGSSTGNLCTSVEATQAVALGFNVEIDDPTSWGAKSTANFATYRAMVLGDPFCQTTTAPISAAESNTGNWGPAVTGPVAVVGTDPEDHAGAQTTAVQLTQNAIAFATSISGQPGAYISLSCYYFNSPMNTPVPVLASFGSFTVQGQQPPAGPPFCPNNSSIVAPTSPLVNTPNVLTNAGLSNWSCSTHEAFNSFPSNFTAVVQSVDLGLPYIITSQPQAQTVTEPLSPTTTDFIFNTPGAITRQTIDYTNSGTNPTGTDMQVTFLPISDSAFQNLVKNTFAFGSSCMQQDTGNGNFSCAVTIALCRPTGTTGPFTGDQCPQVTNTTGIIGVIEKYFTSAFTDPSQVPNPGYLAATDNALSCNGTTDTSNTCRQLHNIFTGIAQDCCTTSGTTKTFNSLFVPVMGLLNPTYSFTGFFQPVDNPPTYNVVKAGGGVPVKFSLGGNFGLNIFATGYPKSSPITCSSTALQDAIETTVTAGQSSLSFDPTSLQYTYVWKTLTGPGWTAGTCRQLQLKFTDGTSEYANFKFK